MADNCCCANTRSCVAQIGTPAAHGAVGASCCAEGVPVFDGVNPRYKDGDANVRPVWLCSRNDAVGNVMVMIAAASVWGTGTALPDLGVAALVAGVFLTSSVQILRRAWAEYRNGRQTHPVAAE